MSEMVNVFLFGKKYSVPSNLTIMRAMEYARYQLAGTASAVPARRYTASRATGS